MIDLHCGERTAYKPRHRLTKIVSALRIQAIITEKISSSICLKRHVPAAANAAVASDVVAASVGEASVLLFSEPHCELPCNIEQQITKCSEQI